MAVYSGQMNERFACLARGATRALEGARMAYEQGKQDGALAHLDDAAERLEALTAFVRDESEDDEDLDDEEEDEEDEEDDDE